LNLDMMWIDELTSFSDPDAAWNVSQMALRIPGPLGDPPVCIITSTPRSVPAFKRIRALPTTVVTISPTMDNAANLSPEALASLVDQYGGTRLGRQELGAEMIDDVDGALWTRQLLEECRIRRGTEPERMRRVIVAIDPPGASGKSSAECGLIVAGIGPDRHGYIMADLSGRYSPEQWASKAIGAFHSYKADRIVAEKNFGGEMVESTLRSIDRSVPLKMVTASRGKQIRAEPIAAFYEQHKVHHIGEFPDLEDQMCSWDPAASGPSPDRVDSAVWALTELMSGPGPMRISQAALERSRQMIPRHAF
jgi:phage terminase large subunit-like protein